MLAIISSAPRVLSVTRTLLGVNDGPSYSNTGLCKGLLLHLRLKSAPSGFVTTKKAPAATGAFNISVRDQSGFNLPVYPPNWCQTHLRQTHHHRHLVRPVPQRLQPRRVEPQSQHYRGLALPDALASRPHRFQQGSDDPRLRFLSDRSVCPACLAPRPRLAPVWFPGRTPQR